MFCACFILKPTTPNLNPDRNYVVLMKYVLPGGHPLVPLFSLSRSTGIQDDPGQPIWTQAIIPAEPDAWIWAGDMAYLDHPVSV